MDRYVDGDPAAVAELIRALTPIVRRRLSGLLGTSAAVDDVLQQTFLSAHLMRDRFHNRAVLSDAAVVGWYLTIARNTAIDALRSDARRRARHERAHAERCTVEPTAEELLIRHEDRERTRTRVCSAVAALSPALRTAIELHRLQELPMSEAARRTGIRPGALRVRAHRAYRALSAALADCGDRLAAGAFRSVATARSS